MNEKLTGRLSDEQKFNKAMAADLAAVRANRIKPGSTEMENYLAIGYPEIQTRAHALELLAERKKNPASVPWEVMQKCNAFLAALDVDPDKQVPYHPETDRFGNVIK